MFKNLKKSIVKKKNFNEWLKIYIYYLKEKNIFVIPILKFHKILV